MVIQIYAEDNGTSDADQSHKMILAIHKNQEVTDARKGRYSPQLLPEELMGHSQW